jgi:putative DNA primase/helicase
LRGLRQWVVWREEQRNGDKPTKIPYTIGGRHASTKDPDTWTTYNAARQAKGFDGVGFVFTAADPYVGLDLDGCLDNQGELKPWARPIVKRFRGTYAEFSPSGRGLHIICKGTLSGGKGRQIAVGGGRVELYADRRFFTVTGKVFREAPSSIRNCQDDLDRLLAQGVTGRVNGSSGAKAKPVLGPGSRHNGLTSIAASMRARGLTGTEILTALQNRNFAACDPPLDPDEVRQIAAWSANQSATFDMTETGNGLRFAVLHAGVARYCPDWNCWLIFDGRRWRRDNTCEADRLAFEVTRSMAAEAAAATDANYSKSLLAWANRCKSNHAQRAILDQAKKWLAVTPADFDRDGDLLNLENGTLDLRTGTLRPHSPDDLLTMIAPTNFEPEARCPVFGKFLKEVFQPHPDVVRFLLHALGYSLCGDVSEQCLFVLYGSGANGKSTLLETVRAVLGEYAGVADSAALLVRRYDSGPRDAVAALRGKRLVTMQEADEGARLQEGLVKWLTGGDKITARRLHENLSEFSPTWKIFWAVNRKPVIRGTDFALWRRLRLLPFDVSFKGREDRALGQKLLAEREGILRLLVDHHQRWRAGGLEVPAAVSAATGAYRAESDQVGRFLEERGTISPKATVSAQQLYADYSNWCDVNGEERLTNCAFGLRLMERGVERRRARYMGKTAVLYVGIGSKG